MAKSRRWVVTICEDHFIEDMAKELAKLGLVKQHMLAPTGCITGIADARAIPRMRKLDGVLAIEPETSLAGHKPSL